MGCYSYFITWIKLHDVWCPDWKYLLVELVAGFPAVLLGCQMSTWREPEMSFRASTDSPYFTWPLSFSTWGLIWMGYPVACTDLRTVADRRGYRAF
jgi:hypothetical protein